MNHNVYLLVPLLVPVVGAVLLWLPWTKSFRRGILTATLALETVYTALAFGLSGSCTLLVLGPAAIAFGSDYLSKLFSLLFAALFWAGGMGKSKLILTPFQETHCLLMLTALLGLCYANNLFTFTLFCLLLTALLLIEPPQHRRGARTRILPIAAVAAAGCIALGAVLFALYAPTSAFHNGGLLTAPARLIPQLRGAATLLLLGFFGWMCVLPPAAYYRARPRLGLVATILPCAGALGMLRMIYYLFGSRFLINTHLRTLLLSLALAAVLAGGIAACLARQLEQRLTFLAVCQSGSVVLGLLLLKQTALWGAILQSFTQAVGLYGLFLCAASFRNDAGCSTLNQLRGMGRQTPPLWTAVSAAGLALGGLPPFVGSWALRYLVQGGLLSASPWNLLGAAAAALTALLTGCSLWPTVWRGWFPGKGYEPDARLRTDPRLVLTVLCLALALLGAGVFPGRLMQLIRSAAVSVI